MTDAAKLDRLYPKLSRNRRCAVCGKPAEHVHHIIGRANILLRWDVKNLIPLCQECHQRIHAHKEELILAPARRLYLNRMKNVVFQNYLLEFGLTREDFYKQKAKELKEAING